MRLLRKLPKGAREVLAPPRRTGTGRTRSPQAASGDSPLAISCTKAFHVSLTQVPPMDSSMAMEIAQFAILSTRISMGARAGIVLESGYLGMGYVGYQGTAGSTL